MGERASAEDKLRDTPDEASRDHHGADDSGGDGQLGYRMIADDALGAVPSVGRNGGACGFRHDHHRNRTAFATVSERNLELCSRRVRFGGVARSECFDETH